MSMQKIKQTDIWIVDTEEEAVDMIEDYKANQDTEGYTVTDSGYKAKIKKSKGQIADITYRVTVARSFE